MNPGEGQSWRERSSVFGHVETSTGDWRDGLEIRRGSQLGESLEIIGLWVVIEAAEAEGMALFALRERTEG